MVLDRDWFRANGIVIPTGRTAFGVVLGNDKYGAPAVGDDGKVSGLGMAETVINKGSSFTGVLAVRALHPTNAVLGATLTVAAYEKADLANPVAVVTGTNANETVLLTGLRPGASYYVAAWSVKDKGDGRASAEERLPYDTWGYLTA